MKYLNLLLMSLILLSGCAFNRYQSDVADNEYFRMERHADATANYVGEWTTGSNVGIRSVKIKADGRLKVCLFPSSGTRDGKVYLDNGVPAIIMDTGAKVKILSANKDLLLLDIYGKQEEYYAGQAPGECATSFKNF